MSIQQLEMAWSHVSSGPSEATEMRPHEEINSACLLCIDMTNYKLDYKLDTYQCIYPGNSESVQRVPCAS